MDLSKPNYETITVTPEMAQTMIKHVNYRRLSPRRVNSYSRVMSEEGWGLSQPLIFNDSGELIDGQHRLHAVIRTGKPQKFVFLSGIPSESISSIDSGQPRTGAQVLMAERTESHGSAASIVRCVRYMPVGVGGSSGILNSELPALWDKYQPYVGIVCEMVPKDKGLSRAPFKAAIVRALMHRPDAEETIRILVEEMKTSKFRQSLNGGILLRMLITEPNSGGTALNVVYLKSARVIQSEIDGISLSKIYTPTVDPFPLPDKFK